jgi:drug/metabolite transporter (DMT)-like permease
VLTPAGILWGALILDESISGQILISLLLVLAGLALTEPAFGQIRPKRTRFE